MPALFFLALLKRQRQLMGPTLLGAAVLTAGTIALDSGGFSPLPWLLWGIPMFLLLGAVEPVLVVLVAAEAGTLWGGATMWNFGTGATLAMIVVFIRLQEHRGRSVTIAAALGTLLLAAVGLHMLLKQSLIFFPVLAALVLAPLGMTILLPRGIKSGTPRVQHLLGGMWVFVFMAVLQFLLLNVATRLMKPAGVRHLGRRGVAALFGFFPYGKFDRFGMDGGALDEPGIVVSNHQSSVDVPVILTLPGDIRLTMSERIWKQPWLGISARRLGHIMVDDNLLESCAKVMTEGASVHFFPEGTRSYDGYPKRFHRGAFELAVQLKRDVIPVVLCDTRQSVPRGGYWVENFHMSLRILARVPPGDDSRALQKKVQAMVREAFEKELARINTPRRVRRKVLRNYRYMGWRVYFGVRTELRRRVPEPTNTIADCGYGTHVHWLSELHPRKKFTATDTDPGKIAVARRSAAGAPQLTFAVA